VSALVSVPSIALGVLVGAMVVRAAKALAAGSRSPGWIARFHPARPVDTYARTVAEGDTGTNAVDDAGASEGSSTP
jgi:hypothetical protein